MALKMYIPSYFVKTGRVGGAEHMFYNLVYGLSASAADLLLAYGSDADLSGNFLTFLQGRSDIARLRKPFAGPRFLAEQGSCFLPPERRDATLFPNYFTPPLLPARLGKVVTVIHDLQYRHFPEYFPARKRAWLRCSHRLTMERADTVVCISEVVKEDLLAVYGERFRLKLRTIHNPVCWDRFGPEGQEHPLHGRPYLLSVAAQYPHKNLPTLVRAFAQLAQRYADVQLVLVGQLFSQLAGEATRQSDIAELIASLGLQERVLVTGYVDDQRLGAWYRHASGFLFPSLFEGFGMPPVEALGLGVPTVTSRASSLPEVTLGKCAYVEKATDVDEWAAVLVDLLDRPDVYRVSAAVRASIREHYAPATIAGRYLDVCGN
jgi:glycosyltransferase involved in cell wall biosynthesis